ncbi:hypothetical protein RHOFW104T7_07345 [Rhodanobacter thiooxydans]|uniref:Polysaccharide polymerase n=1 Tax=Rhodanobacter thiooxydans TaxID=416169 RepID=A0A154QKJ2_9GAMM|nr:hypothetical protein [Rhodanobacter thiooxydans]EIL99458.1 hypothetical protein UUA_08671 [Rhodanobacter thiooxydans LCS2]KZC24719.1 hypothetical protein RHOFW104T7_07345 [Rhodanobacter thiooxydans]MCW0200425.1 hypothetical protein [Rhodanobacter thiooxydans]
MTPGSVPSVVPPTPVLMSSAALSFGGRYRLTVRHMFLAMAFVLLLLTVVVPNSLQIPSAVALVLAALLALPALRIRPGFRTLLALYACTVIVTLFYMGVGGVHDAPAEAQAQVTLIYIISPLLWMIVADGLLRQLGTDRLIGWFVLLSLLSALSVGLFFYLYLTRGAAAVSFFFEGANVNLNEGFSGATMHVYGSLIFLSGGFFSSPELIKSRLLRLVLLAMLLVCALTSGRTALILAVPLGWFLGLLLTPRTTVQPHRSAILRIIRYGVPMAVAVAIALLLLDAYTQISLSKVLDAVTTKLASGGGPARVQMTRSLFAGILANDGLGSGHGVGVAFVSDAEYPWRYELVWLATLYRVGMIGTLVYALPFLLYIIAVIRLAIGRRLQPRHKFMFCGFVCAFLGTNTNPYIEAFVFQWMYVIPLVALAIEYPLALRKLPE